MLESCVTSPHESLRSDSDALEEPTSSPNDPERDSELDRDSDRDCSGSGSCSVALPDLSTPNQLADDAMMTSLESEADAKPESDPDLGCSTAACSSGSSSTQGMALPDPPIVTHDAESGSLPEPLSELSLGADRSPLPVTAHDADSDALETYSTRSSNVLPDPSDFHDESKWSTPDHEGDPLESAERLSSTVTHVVEPAEPESDARESPWLTDDHDWDAKCSSWPSDHELDLDPRLKGQSPSPAAQAAVSPWLTLQI